MGSRNAEGRSWNAECEMRNAEGGMWKEEVEGLGIAQSEQMTEDRRQRLSIADFGMWIADWLN